MYRGIILHRSNGCGSLGGRRIGRGSIDRLDCYMVLGHHEYLTKSLGGGSSETNGFVKKRSTKFHVKIIIGK